MSLDNIHEKSEVENSHKDNVALWKAIVLKFQKPCNKTAIGQLFNTVVPVVGLWFLIWYTLGISWWLTLGLAALNGLFYLRLFIIFHDCGHGSFFTSQRANHVLGMIIGPLFLTSYWHWRWEHAVHHSTTGHLDKRGTGDVWTLTVREYLEATRWKKIAYRLVRNPVVLFVLAPMFLFYVLERLPAKKAPQRERYSVYFTNLVLIGMLMLGVHVFGFKEYLIIQLFTSAIICATGVWLFYVQHQFEDTYWEKDGKWDYTAAALKGSSFYKLPRLLQWFTGNIGFHHIHHLSAKIPNYNLEKCHKSHPMFEEVKPLTLLSSFKSMSYRLWDEQQKKLVGYRRLRELKKEKLKNNQCQRSIL
jgi:omega-6 fatty acid desaturase (delta-12 desaturase)